MRRLHVVYGFGFWALFLLGTSGSYADLLIVLTIVHFDGTSILSLRNDSN